MISSQPLNVRDESSTRVSFSRPNKVQLVVGDKKKKTNLDSSFESDSLKERSAKVMTAGDKYAKDFLKRTIKVSSSNSNAVTRSVFLRNAKIR